MPSQSRVGLVVGRYDFATEVERLRRSGDEECHPNLLEAAREFLASRPYSDWSSQEVDDFLYACAHDGGHEELVGCLSRFLDDDLCLSERRRRALRTRFLRLAERVLERGERENRWQFASHLGRGGRPDREVEKLLLAFSKDEDELVRRMALESLARVGSSRTQQVALEAWKRGPEEARMMALWALHEVNSPSFVPLLEEAAAGKSPDVARFARSFQVPVLCLPLCGPGFSPSGIEVILPSQMARVDCRFFPRFVAEFCLEADVVLTTYARERDPELLEQGIYRWARPCYQIRLNSIRLSIREIAYFCSQALHWLGLPISEVGDTPFGGEYRWGLESDRFTLCFRPQSRYPDKADWLEVLLSFGNEGGNGELLMELDRSCVEQFVRGWVELDRSGDCTFG